MEEEIRDLLDKAPDTIEEGGWARKDLRPIKEAILKLAAKVDPGKPSSKKAEPEEEANADKPGTDTPGDATKKSAKPRSPGG